MPFAYRKDQSLPDSAIWWRRYPNGPLWDFSVGWSSFAARIGVDGQTALVTSGVVTGAAGSGVEPTGVPNIVIAWPAAVFVAVRPGPYRLKVTATSSAGGKPLIFEDTFTILDSVN